MKKIALIILAAFCAAICSQAQLRYGARVGGVFNHPTGSKELKGGNGFAGGLALEFQLPVLPFAIGATAMYERRNEWQEVAASEGVAAGRNTIGKNYISVPIDIKYKIGIPAIASLAGPYIFTGPDFAWRLGSGMGPRTHVGWNVGAGFDIINVLQISGGYRFGITNINPTDGPKWHDSGAFVAVTVLFDI
ncbi:MAG: PorT family protein [Clostridium sp.]|nr:PorT family protein [Clostridium sp.]